MIQARPWFQQRLRDLEQQQPRCPYVGRCGGCTLQALPYAQQLTLKAEWVRERLAEVGWRHEVPIVGLDDPWRYRGKAELSFGVEDGQLVLGYHMAKSFQRVVDIEDCVLMPEPVLPVARALLQAARSSGLPPYNARRHAGVLRHVVLRFSELEQRMLVAVVTTREGRDFAASIAGDFMRRFPLIKGFYWGLNEGRSDVIAPEQLELLQGEGHLNARIGEFVVAHHALSFLQASSVQADRIYTFVRDALPAKPDGAVWDLYCGLGLLGFYLSRNYGTVYGIEVESRTLELAEHNAASQSIQNMRFRSGPAEEVLIERNYWLGEAKPHAVAVDPPRAGLTPRVIATLLAARPQAIAYVSCNVQSLVRDLQVLTNAYPKYRLKNVRAFDMFPQTHHVETVAILQKQGMRDR